MVAAGQQAESSAVPIYFLQVKSYFYVAMMPDYSIAIAMPNGIACENIAITACVVKVFTDKAFADALYPGVADELEQIWVFLNKAVDDFPAIFVVRFMKVVGDFMGVTLNNPIKSV